MECYGKARLIEKIDAFGKSRVWPFRDRNTEQLSIATLAKKKKQRQGVFCSCFFWSIKFFCTLSFSFSHHHLSSFPFFSFNYQLMSICWRFGYSWLKMGEESRYTFRHHHIDLVLYKHMLLRCL